MEDDTKTKTQKVLVLRTCDQDMKSHGGFQWPTSGHVSAPDWKDNKECGNGLHGLLWGQGDYSLTSSDDSAKWLAVEVDEDSIVDLDSKVKFPAGNVVYAGDYATAATIVARALVEYECSKIKEDTATSSGEYSSKLAASGYYSKLAASGDSSQLAASGDYSQLAASGDSSRLAASGDSSIVVSSGYSSVAKAGSNGVIALAWNDGNRPRIAVGYVGEGLKADTLYSVNEKGEFVEVES